MKNEILKKMLILITPFLIGAIPVQASKKVLKIAVIDSGFGFGITPDLYSALKICPEGGYDFITKRPGVGIDVIGHGTEVTSILMGTAKTKNSCVLVLKVFGGPRQDDDTIIDKALLLAEEQKADVINMSLSIREYSDVTKQILRRLTKKGVKIFAAAGNEGKNLNDVCNTYPACYKLGNGLEIVGAYNDDYEKESYSNYGAFITVYKYGRTYTGARGTSFAAPQAAGEYIRSLNLDK